MPSHSGKPGGTLSGAANGPSMDKTASLATVPEEPDGGSFGSFGSAGPGPGFPGPLSPVGPREGGPAYGMPMPGPSDLGGYFHPMGGGGPPPYPPGPPGSMWWGGYGGLGNPGMAPPFPPGMMPYGAYGGQQSAPANYRSAGESFGNHQQMNGRPSRKGKGNQLHLSEALADTGGRSQKPRSQNSNNNAQPAAAAAPKVEPDRQLPENELTTVMMRNVPNGYSRGMLLELLNNSGFSGRYDFVYLPMDFRNGVNLGYAFVNLINHEDAVMLTNKLQGFSQWVSDSTKVCEISWAHPHQGLQEHVERYRNSPVMHHSMPDDYKPMIFMNGVQVAFPPPTKAI